MLSGAPYSLQYLCKDSVGGGGILLFGSQSISLAARILLKNPAQIL